MDCCPPGSSVHGIFQAMEWVALQVSLQVPLSMEFSRQWSGLPLHFLPQEIFPIQRLNPGIRPTSLGSPALASRFFTTAPLGKPLGQSINTIFKRLLFFVFLIGWTVMSLSHAHISSEPFLGSSHRYFLMSLSYFLQIFQSFIVLIRLIDWYLIYNKQRMSPIYIMHSFGNSWHLIMF